MSSVVLANLKRDSDERTFTDKIVSPLWILAPILAAVIEVVLAISILAVASTTISSISSTSTAPSFGMAGALGLFAFVALVPLIIDLYIVYMLLRRRNLHFAREQRFVTDLLSVMRTAANRKGTNIDGLAGSIEGTSRSMQINESEKSAALYTILLIIPVVDIIIGLYILYFLTNDFYKHERMEDNILQDISSAAAAMGLQFVYHRRETIPQRSFVLYLVLSIITFGIFALYWYYVLIKDPNNHFAEHSQFEPMIIQTFAPLVS